MFEKGDNGLLQPWSILRGKGDSSYPEKKAGQQFSVYIEIIFEDINTCSCH
jgi:hypothetical protein